jgi:hypothetical protein
MTRLTRRDPVTGLTDAELATLAEQAYDQRDNPDAWEEEEPPEIAPDVRSVVSVRFNRGELGPIERAAAATGVPVSTYIRNAAINAVGAVDIDEARRSAHALQQDLAQLVTALGAKGHSRKNKRGRTSVERRAVA